MKVPFGNWACSSIYDWACSSWCYKLETESGWSCSSRHCERTIRHFEHVAQFMTEHVARDTTHPQRCKRTMYETKWKQLCSVVSDVFSTSPSTAVDYTSILNVWKNKKDCIRKRKHRKATESNYTEQRTKTERTENTKTTRGNNYVLMCCWFRQRHK